MMAMKMRAGRGSAGPPRHQTSSSKRCGITSVAEALQLYEEFFPEDRFQIELFAARRSHRRRLVPSHRDFVGSRGSAYGHKP